ncbi:MAG: ABC transporter permease subunit [Gemella sp.]|nr:ABC transporter permease subunit [Gemella sp.]
MGLFINEFVKDYKKISTKIYMLLIIAIMVIPNIGNTWGKDKAVALSSGETATLIIDSLGIAATLSYVFILIMLANNISQEYSKGTIKFLYSKPYSRSSILTSKILLAIFNFVFFTVIAFVVDMLLKKFVFYKGMNLSSILSTQLGETNYSRILSDHLIIMFIMLLLTTIFYISLVTLICIVFRSQILSVIVVLVMLLGGSLISQLTLLILPKFEYIKYFFTNVQAIGGYFDNVESRFYTQETFKLSPNDLLIMAVVYTLIFFAISYLVNSRRDVKLD